MIFSAAAGTEKSITTSTAASRLAASGTPSGLTPAIVPASSPSRGCCGASMAATTDSSRIGGRQGNQPLSHASGGPVNGNAKWHESG